MAITTIRGRVLSDPRSIVHPQVNDVELDDEVNNAIPAKSKKLGDLE